MEGGAVVNPHAKISFMKTGIHPLVIGNWKMNPQTGTLANKLAKELKKSLRSNSGVDVVVAPPSIYIDALSKIKGTSRAFSLGAQNVHHEKLGSHTGEISLSMLKSYGVTHIILGHSERRKEGETDVSINLKLNATIAAGLTGIVCVGETKRDAGGNYLSLVETQVKAALKGVPKNKLGQLAIAYEPVWAIGTGENATPGDVHEMKLFVERIVSDLYGRNLAQKVRILYGGSVNGKNARELFTLGMVNGFLVGGASLDADEFAQIVMSARS
jgi:triosephosphate isomerase